jgi:hypothetical protein
MLPVRVLEYGISIIICIVGTYLEYELVRCK